MTVLLKPPYRRLTIGIVSVILVLAFEAMAVGTAMPAAVDELDGIRLYAWAFSGFLAGSLWGMVWAGEECDRRGPARPLLLGIAAFIVGLVLSGAAPDMLTFILGRVVQGVGSGAVIVAIYVVVARAYPEELRPRVFSAMASAWILPSIVGPLIAGVVADTWSWRWVFLAVPLLVVPAVVLILPRLRAVDDAGPAGAGRPGIRRLALMAAVGVAGLQYAGQRLDLWSIPVLLLAVGLLATSVPRLLPPGTLMLRRGLPTTVAMRGLLAGGFFGAESFIPLMLVNERGLSTTFAGLSLTGAALGWATGSWFQSLPSLDMPRALLVRRGAAFVCLSVLALCLALLPSVPVWIAGLAWTFSGFGMGMALPTLSVVLYELSPLEDQGANTAALQVSDALGSTVFIGLAGVIFAAGHTSAGEDADVFAVIFVTMAVVLAVAAWAAGRIGIRRRVPAVQPQRSAIEEPCATERAAHS